MEDFKDLIYIYYIVLSSVFAYINHEIPPEPARSWCFNRNQWKTNSRSIIYYSNMIQLLLYLIVRTFCVLFIEINISMKDLFDSYIRNKTLYILTTYEYNDKRIIILQIERFKLIAQLLKYYYIWTVIQCNGLDVTGVHKLG